MLRLLKRREIPQPEGSSKGLGRGRYTLRVVQHRSVQLHVTGLDEELRPRPSSIAARWNQATDICWGIRSHLQLAWQLEMGREHEMVGPETVRVGPTGSVQGGRREGWMEEELWRSEFVEGV